MHVSKGARPLIAKNLGRITHRSCLDTAHDTGYGYSIIGVMFTNEIESVGHVGSLDSRKRITAVIFDLSAVI